MKKLISILMIVIMLAAMLTVYAYDPNHTESAVEPELFISLCDSQPESSLIGQTEQQFGKYLEEASNGRIALNYYSSAALGDDVSCMQQVQIGALDMCRCDAAILNLFGLPAPQQQTCNVESPDTLWQWLQDISTQDNGITSIGYLVDWSRGLDNDTCSICPVVFSDLTWNQLSANDQEIIVDCWNQAFQWYISQSEALFTGYTT